MGSAMHTRRIDCSGVSIAVSVSGAGAPVLLLHGYPQTKAMWERVAAALAGRYTVVSADLRGYGESDRPAGDVYSKREMATDQVAVMRELGYDRFFVAGHDRGGRVAHRMAVDHPDAVAGIAVLDIVPTLHMFENVDRTMATSYFHWFFLSRPGGLPEDLITAAPRAWLESRFAGRNPGTDGFVPDAFAEYLRCFDDECIRASCADYRAAATVDLEHDREDQECGRVISAPLLALWGQHSYVGRNFDVTDIWRSYATTVSGRHVDAEHYLAEEAPEATAAALAEFLTREDVVW